MPLYPLLPLSLAERDYAAAFSLLSAFTLLPCSPCGDGQPVTPAASSPLAGVGRETPYWTVCVAVLPPGGPSLLRAVPWRRVAKALAVHSVRPNLDVSLPQQLIASLTQAAWSGNFVSADTGGAFKLYADSYGCQGDGAPGASAVALRVIAWRGGRGRGLGGECEVARALRRVAACNLWRRISSRPRRSCSTRTTARPTAACARARASWWSTTGRGRAASRT